MRISFRRLPAEGQTFSWTQADSEMQQTLAPQIGEAEFRVELNLKPVGEAIEAKGFFRCSLPLDCSFCAENYAFPLDFSFAEYLFARDTQARGPSKLEEADKSWSKKQLDEADKMGVCVDGDDFLLGDYLFERIGFAIPFQVPCQSEKETCENYIAVQSKLAQHQAPESQDTNPFEKLRGLKVDKSH